MLKVFRKHSTPLLVLSFMLVATTVFAQDVAPVLPVGADDMQKIVIGTFALLLPFATKKLREVVPTMPRMLVWSLPSILGLLGTWGVSYLSAAVNPWSGLLSGLLAVALWEAKSTLKDHGLNG